MKQILLSKKNKEIADTAESNLRQYPVKTILDALTIATDFTVTSALRSLEYRDSIKECLKDRFVTEWGQFGIYGKNSVQYMETRSEFVNAIMDSELAEELENENITSYKLAVLSRHPIAVDYPNIAWCFKLYAVKRGFDDFAGTLANTGPCRKATELLFGVPYNSDQVGHTLLCHRLSVELEASPNYVNTLLWAFGMRIKRCK